MSGPEPRLPAVARLLVHLTTSDPHRGALERDLAEELERVRRVRGRWASVRFLLKELVGVVGYGLRDRMGREGRSRRGARRRGAGRAGPAGAVDRTLRSAVMDHLWRDLRGSIRSLVGRPGFTAAAALTLALGIGPTTAIFSVVRHVLLGALPYEAPDRIVQVWNPWTNEPGGVRGRSPMSTGDFVDLRGSVAGLEDVAAFVPPTSANLTGGDVPERVRVTGATARLFEVLGADAVVGRTYSTEEDAPGRGDVAVLSHGLWQRRFGGDLSVLGSTLHVDGVAHRVVGVMPPAFRMPSDYLAGDPTEVWTPLGLDTTELDRGNQWLFALARLREGARLAVVDEELESLTRRWVEQGFKIRDHAPYYAVTIEEELLGAVRGPLLLVLGAVLFVLLVACVNVANLLLARADDRRGELALRTALGASRGRIVGRLLTESVVLALLGGGLGLALAYLGVEGLVALDPASVPRIDEVRIDGPVLGFAMLLTLATALLFGLAPAVRVSRLDLVERLKSDSRSSTGCGREHRLRGALVTAQVALAVLLTIGATLMARTVGELSRVELGFVPDSVLTFGLSLPAARYPGSGDRIRFYGRLVERLEDLPGARSAGAVSVLPLTAPLGGGSIEVEGAGRPGPGQGWPNARWQIVTPGYFRTMEHTLTAGRVLDPGGGDGPDAVPVVVVNRTLDETFWPGESAVGKRLRPPGGDGPWLTVVGVVEDVRHSGLVDRPSPTLYVPLAQLTAATGSAPTAMSLALATTGAPDALAGAVRGLVRTLDPDLPVADVRTMASIVADARARPRFVMTLLTIFAGVGLVIAGVGIHGVLFDTVSRRRGEIGIRMALGSSRSSVLALVVREGLRFALLGVVLGLVAALFLTRLMASLLYGVRPLDAATFLLVPAVCALVALAASYLPARRAVLLDPMKALRDEVG